MNKKKKNIPMIVALSIPVLMVILIAGSIYIPALFVEKPQFDFIYYTGWNHCQGYQFIVKNSKIIKKELEPPKNDNYSCHHRNNTESKIFYYDVQENTTTEMVFEEAQKFRVDKRGKSPDGYKIVSGNRDFDFFFGGSSYYERYLKKGTYSRRIELDEKYYYGFRLLGWIKADSEKR